MRTGMSTAGLALLAGLIFPLGLSPLDFWPAIPVSAGALYAILNRDGLLTSWRIGLAYGIGFFGAGVSWVYVSVHVYGATPVWLAVLLTAIFCGGLALIFSLQSHLYARFAGNQPDWRIVQFSSLWVLMEWLRTFLLTGFPWAFAGYGVLDSPLSGWIPVLGIYGCSWLLVGLGCLGAEILSGRHTRAFLLRAGAITTLAFVAAFGWQRVVWTQPTGEPLSVSAVQPNIPLAEKWDPRKRPQILADFDALSEQLYAESDLIVWPESALPGYRDQLQSTLQRVNESAKSLGKAVITGIPTRDHMGRYNSVAVLGAGQGTYHKQKLVPFGEYVPLEGMLRGLNSFFDLPMSSFSLGSTGQSLLTVKGQPIATAICYEIAYPDLVAESAADASMILTVSNDAWFVRSIAPQQHMQMARMRALENSKPMLRGTNNGITALVDYRGVIYQQLEQFTAGELSGSLQPRVGQTVFSRWGSWPTVVFSIFICICLIVRRRKQDTQA